MPRITQGPSVKSTSSETTSSIIHHQNTQGIKKKKKLNSQRMANDDISYHHHDRQNERPFEIRLSLRFIIFTIFAMAAVSFATGRAALTMVLYKQQAIITAFVPPDTSLPPPTYSELKDVPHTVYSSKNFDTGVDATSDSVLARRADGFVDRHVDTSMTEDLHEPAGQHLLIDIKSVDGAFLNSKDRLASAMVNLINLSGLTMLSYHCHALVPVGVSCVGVLLESHISVRH